MPTVRHLIVRIERRRLVRFRRRLVIRRRVVRLAVRQRQRAQFVSRTRLNPGPQVTRVTLHQEGGIGKATRPRRGTAIPNGHGQVHVHKDRDLLLPDPRHPIKVAPDLCRHRPSGCGGTGRGAPPLRPPAPPNTGNWRPEWRSPTGGGNRMPPAQPQSAPAPRRWLRNNGCYVCGQPGCHSDFHGPDAVSPQAPPGLQCFVCGRWGCHSSRHSVGGPPPAPSTQGQAPGPPQRPALVTANQQSNWQRGSTQGERVPPAPPRPQSN